MELVDLLSENLLALSILVVTFVVTAHTGILQVREFRDRTGEDSYLTRIVGATRHPPAKKPTAARKRKSA